MEPQSVSKLQFYSLGLVSANKKLSSKNIEVTPTEHFPMLNGEITDNTSKYSAKMQDASGSVKSVQVDTTATINATWLPISNSNRKTAPDVRRGETVVIYKFADTDKYWWNTVFDDSVLRRLETVIYAFSNNSKEGPTDDENSTYFLSVSTHKKLVHFHTSKNDGEPFAYDVQIDTKNGKIIITDDADNFFVLDSANRRLTLKNGDGSIVDVNRTNILFEAADSISMKAKDLNLTASGATTVKSGTNTISGDTEVKDKLKVDGKLTLGAGMAVVNGSGGNSTINGDINVIGSLTASTTITAPNLKYI